MRVFAWCVVWMMAMLGLSVGQAMAATPKLAAGVGHSVMLKDDGTLLAVGSDGNGELGQGHDAIVSAVPLQVAGLVTARKMAGGRLHSVALSQDGTVWAWGLNYGGQLGDGTTTERSTPVRVLNLTGVTAIAAGADHTLALKQDGTVWGWGDNSTGQLGDAATVASTSTPVQIKNLVNVTALAAGGGHTLALKQDGTVWAWGDNTYGQLGDGTATPQRSTPAQVANLTDVIAIASGLNHTLALKKDGTVWAWGDNGNGALGNGTSTDSATPVRVANLSNVTALAAEMGDGLRGHGHSLALKQDGTAWAWGDNTYGQLGDGTVISRSTPVPVVNLTDAIAITAGAGIGGRGHSHALKRDGSVWAWGDNTYGQLGDGSTTRSRTSTPQRVLNLTNATAIAAGGFHTLALMQNGTLQAWGADSFGQLGDGTLPNHLYTPVRVANFTNAVAVAAGDTTTLAVKQDGTVWAWGLNNFGQLGDGTTTLRGTPVPVPNLTHVTAIAAGEAHTLALKQDGTVWAWGLNLAGQLGDGTEIERHTPVPVANLANVVAIATGSYHSLALKQDGTVWAWGYNGVGQLGDGTAINRNTPVQVVNLTNVTTISAGMYHTLALKPDGTVWAWGNNANGQLGDGTVTKQHSPVRVANLTKMSAIAAGSAHALALKQDGTVWAWGNNFLGQLGDGAGADRHSPVQVANLTDVSAIAAGSDHALAMKRDGTVWSWGSNSFGQLGNGTLLWNSHTPTNVLNETANGLLSLTPSAPIDSASQLKTFFLKAKKSGNDLSATFADLRAGGFNGDVYFTALLPRSSPILKGNRLAAEEGTVGATLCAGRPSAKQPSTGSIPCHSGTINTGDSFAATSGEPVDILAGGNAVISMCMTTPEWSAKGQALCRPIASGDQTRGVVQGLPVQTRSSAQLYTAQASGPLNARTLTAQINPLDEDRGQPRVVCSWASARDGTQYMQTEQGWTAMTAPMLPAQTLTVPMSGAITLPVTTNLDLTSMAGTLAFVGLGSSCEDVVTWNKQGQYYTVE